ncbi:MAG: AMP-binding protein [Acidimicrobiales bacterium]
MPTSHTVPAPGQAALPAPDAAALLRRNASDPEIGGRPAVRFADRVWTHAELAAESFRWAHLLLAHRPAGDRPTHVGVLADNTPDYLFALGGAAFAGATVVGLNPTRVGEHLLRDIVHADVDLIVTEPGHLDDLAGLDLADRPVVVSHRFAGPRSGGAAGASPAGRRAAGDLELDDALAAVGADDPRVPVDAATRWALIFTSGTSGAPKAVVCSQRRLLGTGSRLATLLGIGPDDVGYVAMPLFHSNALMVGWAPSIAVGASVGLARRFSVSGFLPDVRRYGATWFNYTGKPLSFLVAAPPDPERDGDEADNPLRVAFGNEGAPQVIDEFARRFGVEVIDAFGSTEGGVALERDAPRSNDVANAPGARPGAMGWAGPAIRIVDESGAECPPAAYDAEGRLTNAEACVGEIVNTSGSGPFEGYYNNPEATERATRRGWYWSGDLGYVDADRHLYFAGRTAEWIRVDGENFPAGPIADALVRHPDVVVAVAYGVPDPVAGDQVMAAVVLRDDTGLDGAGLARWLDTEAGIGPKWRPRFVRAATELPTTGTNKVLTRTLVHGKFRLDRVGADALWVRDRGADAYRPFTREDEEVLRAEFAAAGRTRFWDL